MESAEKSVEDRNLRVSIVVPAYNEAQNLPYVLPLIPPWVHEVILVNDQSTDNTVEVALQYLPDVRIIHTQHTRGKGGALRAGFAAVTGDIIVMMDADGSSDPQEIPRFIEALLTGAYIALGSRLTNGGNSDDITPLRKFGAQALIAIANYLFRVQLTDMFCGLNAFWKDSLDFFEVDCNGFDVETLLVLRACKANLKILEVPCHEHARIHGTSNFRTFRDGWKVLRMILTEWMNGRTVVETAKVSYTARYTNIAWDHVVATRHIGAAQ